MDIFYKPSSGVVGDCIPYLHGDRFHVFYLRDHRDVDGYGIAYSWHHLSTTDFLDFEDHGEALAKGTEDEQDIGVATGSVFTDDDGLHHIFYTGINPYFRDDERREQVILHATSPDLQNWTKISAHRWAADETRFERHDWRDPFVFRHPQTGQPTMLVAARTRSGDPARRGCTAVLTSDDLLDWS
jgi:beta-fructofuranosidase